MRFATVVENTETLLQSAMKELKDASEEESLKLKQEVLIMRKLQHPHIIRYEGSFLNRAGHLCILMDYAGGGDLALRIKRQKKNDTHFPEAVALSWLVQVVAALDFLHEARS